MRDGVTPDELARLFHETYEELAPTFGYKTREASAVPWQKVPGENRRLMIAVAAVVLDVLGRSDRALAATITTLTEALDLALAVKVEHHAIHEMAMGEKCVICQKPGVLEKLRRIEEIRAAALESVQKPTGLREGRDDLQPAPADKATT